MTSFNFRKYTYYKEAYVAQWELGIWAFPVCDMAQTKKEHKVFLIATLIYKLTCCIRHIWISPICMIGR